MNADAITNTVMNRIRPWLGKGALENQIRYAIYRSHDSVISGLTSTDTENTDRYECKICKGRCKGHTGQPPPAQYTTASEAHSHGIPVLGAAGAFDEGIHRAGWEHALEPSKLARPDWYLKEDSSLPSCLVCGRRRPFKACDSTQKIGVCYVCHDASDGLGQIADMKRRLEQSDEAIYNLESELRTKTKQVDAALAIRDAYHEFLRRCDIKC